MADDTRLKSSFELAMERLRQKDAESGVTTRALTDAEKAQNREVRNLYEAKIAEAQVMHQSRLEDAPLRAGEALETEFRAERERFARANADRKVARSIPPVPGVSDDKPERFSERRGMPGVQPLRPESAVRCLTQPPSPVSCRSRQILQNYKPVTPDRLLKPEDSDVLMIRRTYDGWGYSPLEQIDTSNVSRLQPVWSFATGVRERT